jgi:hypothetical protein
MPRLPRIHQKNLEAARLEQLEQRDPINACRFHGNGLHTTLLQPVGQRDQVGRARAEGAHVGRQVRRVVGGRRRGILGGYSDPVHSSWGDGQWHHYVVTWSRGDAGMCTVYQDGAQVAAVPTVTSTGNASLVLTYPPPATGATNHQTYATNIFQDGTGNYTDANSRANWDNATIDDLGIWRRALTDDEITTIYNMGLQGKSALD